MGEMDTAMASGSPPRETQLASDMNVPSGGVLIICRVPPEGTWTNKHHLEVDGSRSHSVVMSTGSRQKHSACVLALLVIFSRLVSMFGYRFNDQIYSIELPNIQLHPFRSTANIVTGL